MSTLPWINMLKAYSTIRARGTPKRRHLRHTIRAQILTAPRSVLGQARLPL